MVEETIQVQFAAKSEEIFIEPICFCWWFWEGEGGELVKVGDGK
jgi:hypothetical protein